MWGPLDPIQAPQLHGAPLLGSIRRLRARIDTERDGLKLIVRLIGRIRFDCIEDLHRQMSLGMVVIFDMTQVDLVDLESVRFLRECQDRSVELRNCSPYILEWIRREGIEGPP